MMRNTKGFIKLAHGSGGRLSYELIHNLIGKYLGNETLNEFLDSALIKFNHSALAFTTDSYTVKPLFFPGGDIGKLSITGTVNDLAMVGAFPLYLSLSLIIEEGFPFSDLERIIKSIKDTSEYCKIKIITGDTKVVEKGKGDGLFINTSGIGVIPDNFSLRIDEIEPGDKIIINGGIGEHGAAIICARGLIDFRSKLRSDCAALHFIVRSLIESGVRVKFMRDPTRGGLASALCELAEKINFNILIEEDKLMIKKEVLAICEFLGFDPLYLANEGKFIIVVGEEDVDKVLKVLNENQSEEASIIGEVQREREKKVLLKTITGGKRIVEMMIEEQLPRIC